MPKSITPPLNAPVLSFLRTASRTTAAGTAVAKAITDWVLDHGADFGIALSGEPAEADDGDCSEENSRHANRRKAKPRWSIVRAAIQRRTRRLPATTRHYQAVAQLGRVVGLEPIDVGILDLSLLYCSDGQVEQLWDTIAGFIGRHHHLQAGALKVWGCLLGYDEDELAARFDQEAPLVDSGLLSISDGDHIYVSHKLRRCIAQPLAAPEEYRRRLLGSPAEATLPWDDFDHLGEERLRIERILAGAVATGTPGVNILIYGPPGTGKTEFCKTLAAKLGWPIFPICEAGDEGGRPERDERTGALALAQKLAGRGEPLLVLFDEAEDVLSRAEGGVGGRAFFHRLLERTPVPVLWTANAVHGFGDAVLRRMTYALEIRIPPARVRERIWRRRLDQAGVLASNDEVVALARDFEAAPALAASAITAAKLTGGGTADVRGCLTSVAKIMTTAIALPAPGEDIYDPRLINADLDLEALASCLVEAGRQVPFSMCLSGPPGTGKSAYAAHLAERLGMTLLRKRASDLLSPYVGESEMNIAHAFAEARSEGSLLLFDEADSLLGSRRSAVRNWEVSQVNEMLTWMERHPLPFICTTNLVERLDEAAARRFLFKARFDFLRPRQLAEAFVTFFGVEPPLGLESLTSLTPADFAIVHRKARLLIPDGDPVMLLRLLRQESGSKSRSDRPAASVGRTSLNYGT